MPLDLACLAVLVLAAVAGAFVGAAPQLANLLAVLAGWGGARVLGPKLAPAIQGHVPAFAAHPIAGVAAFLACTAAGTIVARLILAIAPFGRAQGGGVHRGAGALLGGAHAAMVVWVALSALAVWNRPVRVGSFVVDPERSEFVGFARECNAFGSLAPPSREGRTP